MSTAQLNPINVSPLIRFGRWSLLTAGILYGAFYQRRFAKKERKLREIYEKERPEREAKLAKQKILNQEAEKKFLDDLSVGKI